MSGQVILKFVANGEEKPELADLEELFSSTDIKLSLDDDTYRFDIFADVEDQASIIWEIITEMEEFYPTLVVVQ